MIVLRHAQSEFNRIFSATRRDPGITDPPLTALGLEQAHAAAASLAGSGLTRIVASPYTRALQTGSIVAAALGLRLEVSALVREHRAFACDVGSPRSRLAAAWPGLDFAGIDEVWWADGEETAADVRDRADRFLAAMAAAADQRTTAVVCHWGFAHALTGVSLENAASVEIDPRIARARAADDPYR